MWLWPLFWLCYIRTVTIIEIIRICWLQNNFLGIFKSILLDAYTLWSLELMLIVGAWRVVRLWFNCYLVAFFFFEILHKIHHLIMHPALFHKVTLCLLHFLLNNYFLFFTKFLFGLILWRCLRWYIGRWLIKYFYLLILFDHSGFSGLASCPCHLIWPILHLFCRCKSLGNWIEDRQSVANVSSRCLIFLIDNLHWKSLKLYR